jgi:tRNA pseudouridine55 synthase
MSRRKKGDLINGWINLDKPFDMTSTDALAKVRRAFNAQKAGHGGTLDPLATGILPIALGEATKTIPYCQDAIKIYRFSIVWGEARATDDAEGEIIAQSDIRPEPDAIRTALPPFIGHIQQLPPRFSAIKIDGQRAYDLARAGQTVELAPRPVFIESFDLLETQPDKATFRAVCGKGTYMRSLARDLAVALGTVGYIADLRREAVGPLTVQTAISLEQLLELSQSARLDEILLPVETVLDDIPALAVNEREAARLKNGQKLLFMARPDLDRLTAAGVYFDDDSATALALYQNKPIALVSVNGAEIQPLRVLNL